MQEKKGEPILGRTTLSTVKYRGGNKNIWGCMSRNGVRMLTEVEGRMDVKQYVEILDQHLPKVSKLWDFLWRKPFFSRTMILKTPPYSLNLGSRIIESIHFQFLVYSSQI